MLNNTHNGSELLHMDKMMSSCAAVLEGYSGDNLFSALFQRLCRTNRQHTFAVFNLIKSLRAGVKVLPPKILMERLLALQGEDDDELDELSRYIEEVREVFRTNLLPIDFTDGLIFKHDITTVSLEWNSKVDERISHSNDLLDALEATNDPVFQIKCLYEIFQSPSFFYNSQISSRIMHLFEQIPSGEISKHFNSDGRNFFNVISHLVPDQFHELLHLFQDWPPEHLAALLAFPSIEINEYCLAKTMPRLKQMLDILVPEDRSRIAKELYNKKPVLVLWLVCICPDDMLKEILDQTNFSLVACNSLSFDRTAAEYLSRVDHKIDRDYIFSVLEKAFTALTGAEMKWINQNRYKVSTNGGASSSNSKHESSETQISKGKKRDQNEFFQAQSPRSHFPLGCNDGFKHRSV